MLLVCFVDKHTRERARTTVLHCYCPTSYRWYSLKHQTPWYVRLFQRAQQRKNGTCQTIASEVNVLCMCNLLAAATGMKVPPLSCVYWNTCTQYKECSLLPMNMFNVWQRKWNEWTIKHKAYRWIQVANVKNENYYKPNSAKWCCCCCLKNWTCMNVGPKWSTVRTETFVSFTRTTPASTDTSIRT